MISRRFLKSILHSFLLKLRNLLQMIDIEKPDAKDGFHYATCFLPEYRWEDVSGFSEAEIQKYQEIISSTAHLIMRFAAEGGLENAAGF